MADDAGPPISRKRLNKLKRMAKIAKEGGLTIVEQQAARAPPKKGKNTQRNRQRRQNKKKAGPMMGGGDLSVSGYLTAELKKRHAHDLYLYGFVNPAKACRGPGTASMPTILAHFRAQQTLTINPAGGASPAFNPSNMALIVVTPFVRTDGTNSGSINTVLPGYFIDPTEALNSPYPLLGTNPTITNKMMFAPFDVPFPSTFSWGNGGLQSAHPMGSLTYRTVGLRATLTNNTPALSATGFVNCGDNANFFTAVNAQSYSAEPSGGPVVVEELDDYTNSAITQRMESLIQSPRVVAAGQLKAGSVYEAAWLPTSDRALDYKRTIRGHIGQGALTSAADSVASDLLDNPTLVFMLTNPTTTATNLVINIDWVVEIQMERNSGIYWARDMAQSVPRFVPDWQSLACCAVGGKLGCCEKEMMPDSATYSGMGLAALGVPQPSVSGMAMTSLGAVSAASTPSAVVARQQAAVTVAKTDAAVSRIAQVGSVVSQAPAALESGAKFMYGVRRGIAMLKHAWNSPVAKAVEHGAEHIVEDAAGLVL